MSQHELEIIQRLKHIEGVLQNQENDTQNLQQVVGELREIVQDIDKNMAVESEKRSHLFYRVEQLEKEIEILSANGEKTNDRQRDLVEKALMAFLGGLITYIFSLASK